MCTGRSLDCLFEVLNVAGAKSERKEGGDRFFAVQVLGGVECFDAVDTLKAVQTLYGPKSSSVNSMLSLMALSLFD